MIEETWKGEYKQWKDLKPYQIKLIDDGPKSQISGLAIEFNVV